MAAKKVKLITTISKKEITVTQEHADSIFKLQENKSHRQLDYWVINENERTDKRVIKNSEK